MRNLLLLLIINMSMVACSQKDEVEPTVKVPASDSLEVEPTVNEPTPYSLVMPGFFPQNVNVPADNPLTEDGVELGRFLFYEKKLSGNNTMSCGSCHQQEKAFTDGKALAVGIDGLEHKRSTMSLANMLWNKHFNWDGGSFSLEEQARIPIENPVEMHQDLEEAVQELQATALYPEMFLKAFGSDTITEERILKSLSQFERTLISANSRYDQYLQDQDVLTEEEVEGMQLFMTHPEPRMGLRGGNCGDCHGGTLLTMQTFHNNGLDEVFTDNGLGEVSGIPRQNGMFRAPSLRNIALTAPYMHDGRFKTLEEVLTHYNDHMNYNSPNLDPLIIESSNQFNGKTLSLTEEEKRKIILFLHTLTDSTFISDKSFSDPFNK